MNRGLIAKTIREAWLATCLYAAGFLAFEFLFAYVIPIFHKDLSEQWFQLEFVKNILKGLLGTEVGGLLDPGIITAIAWAHPMVLVLIWGHALTFCTRMPAGEIDHGTIDVWLGLPVSRFEVYMCESVVWLVSGLIVITSGLIGNALGGWTADQAPPANPWQLLGLIANLYALYLAVGGIAWAVSTLCDHRGVAVAILLGILITSFALSFLAQFSDVIRSASFLSILTYYRPLMVLRDSSAAWSDATILVGVGLVTWICGTVIFTRRDICTL